MSDPRSRDSYSNFSQITTRWHDNDVYGHVNNVVYYSFFDSAVNSVLIKHGGLDIHAGSLIALVVSSSCDYHAPVAFPQIVEVGLAVSQLGSSSVHYQLALFQLGQTQACATGRVVHVFVDREQRRPAQIPAHQRELLSELMCSADNHQSGN